MSRTARLTPAELAPGPWPEASSSDPFGEIARQFVLRLREAIGARSIRSVAEQSGLSHVTLLNLLHGRAWPDLATIARLEVALNADLYSSKSAR